MNDKVILITGGTGSFGKKFTETLLRDYKPKKVIIFSRDEYKQFEMAKCFPSTEYPIRYFIGDIRDKDRLRRAFDGVDYVVHAAALKQVPALEYNPTEAVKTNVDGADNIVDVAIDAGVDKVVAISTDKAVNPVNLYGATKLVAERIFIAANQYSGGKVRFSVVRYGNVIGSRGSVVPEFMKLKAAGKKVFPLTDERMTRFWITLDQGVALVLKALNDSVGGEVFIPKVPSMKVTDLAWAIDPECDFKRIGIRPGEKLHETLISEDDARSTRDLGNEYVILPQFVVNGAVEHAYSKCRTVEDGFCYRSDKNTQWIEQEEMRRLLNANS